MGTRALPVTLVLVLAVAACGGDDGGTAGDVEASVMTAAAPTSGAAPEAIDTCALLSPDDVGAVVAAPVGEGAAGETVPNLALSDCTFEYEGGTVQISVLVWPSEDEAAGVFDFAVDSNDYPLVEGVGDEAYDAAPAFGLTTRVGTVELNVNVMGSNDGPTELEQEKALARLAIDHL